MRLSNQVHWSVRIDREFTEDRQILYIHNHYDACTCAQWALDFFIFNFTIRVRVRYIECFLDQIVVVSVIKERHDHLHCKYIVSILLDWFCENLSHEEISLDSQILFIINSLKQSNLMINVQSFRTAWLIVTWHCDWPSRPFQNVVYEFEETWTLETGALEVSENRNSLTVAFFVEGWDWIQRELSWFCCTLQTLIMVTSKTHGGVTVNLGFVFTKNTNERRTFVTDSWRIYEKMTFFIPCWWLPDR